MNKLCYTAALYIGLLISQGYSQVIRIPDQKFSISLKYMNCVSIDGSQWSEHFAKVIMGQPTHVTHGLISMGAIKYVGEKSTDDNALTRDFNVINGPDLEEIFRSFRDDMSMKNCLETLGNPRLDYSGNGTTFLWRSWLQNNNITVPVFVMAVIDPSQAQIEDARLEEVWVWVGKFE